ncbi:hypothetical protein BT69DRAFT_749702 [Atractiella rhizophila]|nr:hypothetical protein BT69DRAFT_749702 [Atractiella rhizophila]
MDLLILPGRIAVKNIEWVVVHATHLNWFSSMPDTVVNWISFCAFFSVRVLHLLEESEKRQQVELSTVLLSVIDQLAERFQSAASSTRPYHLLARYSLLMQGLIKVARSKIDVTAQKRMDETETLDMARKIVGICLCDEPGQELPSQGTTHTSPSTANQANSMSDFASEAYGSFDWLDAFLPAATFMSEQDPTSRV